MNNLGFLLINKTKGPSSQQIDYQIKKKFNAKKVGHLGTLDPLAEGLLVVALNDSTRFFKYFESLDKVYILRIRLGATSISLDCEKELIDIEDLNLKGKEDYIDRMLSSFPKVYNQTPPIYSAIKSKGKKLYEYANSGKSVDVKSREVSIFKIKRISEIEYKDKSSFFDIYMHVSKGFYVRSFAKDFAETLHTSGMAQNIKRISIGKFNLDSAKTVDDLSSLDNSLINPIDCLDIERMKIDDKTLSDILVGRRISLDTKEDLILLVHNDKNIAIYKRIIKDIFGVDLLIENENNLH